MQWIVDSGASRHSTPSLSILSEMNTDYRGEATIANGCKMKAFGKGKTTLLLEKQQGKARETLALHGVLWMPEQDCNLISVAQLEKDGFSVHFKDRKCYIKKDGKEMELAEFDGSLYRVLKNL